MDKEQMRREAEKLPQALPEASSRFGRSLKDNENAEVQASTRHLYISHK